MTSDPDRPGRIPAPDEQTCFEWCLALAAAGFDYEGRREGEAWIVAVPQRRVEAARAELAAYEEDNRDWPPAPRAAAPRTSYGGGPGLAGSVYLLLFFLWTGPYDPARPFLAAGAADAGRILEGETWRAVTALLLHADLAHMLGNAAALAGFGWLACAALGAGVAWTLILAAGVGANLLVAALSGGGHVSVGASGACFGALGVLAGLRARESWKGTGRLRSVWDRTWLPLAAGVGLLALLGVGPRSDLAAHAFGLAGGAALGAVAASLPPKRLSAAVQRLLAAACLLAVLAAWHAAFLSLR